MKQIYGRTVALALAIVVVLAPHVRARQTPQLTDEQIEQFLRKARVIKTKGAAKGITGSIRATLSDGKMTHDAHIQTIDQEKFRWQSDTSVEFNFRDSWRFNVATYRIDRLLDLNMVPVSVERRWDNRPGAFTWWVDDVLMDEGERLKQQVNAPNIECWNQQMRLVRILDQLIDNIDRNLGNLLITKDWRIWAIDHTRAFRLSNKPRKPENLTRMDRAVLERLKGLDYDTLRREVGKYITNRDIRMVLSRRDAIVTHFELAGPAALYDRSDPAIGCVAAQ